MASFITGPNISVCWLRAVDLLLKQKRHESYNLFVEILDPLEENIGVRDDLNDILKKRKQQSLTTVANTIFPSELYNNCENRQKFYEKYLKVLPKLKHCTKKNNHGIYFERLIKWPSTKGDYVNQIENIIKRLNTQINNSNPVRVIYEAMIHHPNLDVSVYTPGLDNTIGFPCLSYLSFKLEGTKLHLVAVYRNHFFVERAYGNYLGLAELLSFVCQETACTVGSLCVLSTHAQLESGTTQTLRRMVDKFSDLVQVY